MKQLASPTPTVQPAPTKIRSWRSRLLRFGLFRGAFLLILVLLLLFYNNTVNAKAENTLTLRP